MTDLRTLFIEDSENDALLLLHELQKGGYQVQWERVETVATMQAALDHQLWDLILCDYSMPSLNAPLALKILSKRGLDLPFIIVSGAIEEETAVSALRAGAHDFVVKNNLARLLPAIQRELKEAENRREHQQAADSLRESELRFRNTLEGMLEGCQIIGYDWRYLFINPSAEKHNRRPNNELLGNIYMDMWPGIEATSVYTSLRRCMDERISQHIITEFIFPDGARGWFELSIQPVPDGIFILSSDITKRKQAEQALLEREMKLSILLDLLPVGVSILDAERRISYMNPALKKLYDISEESLHTRTYADRKYLRGDGSPMSFEELASALALREQSAINSLETGVVKEDDSIVWANVSAVSVDFPDWKVVVVASDITEHKKAESEILKLNAELEEKVSERTAELAEVNDQLYKLSFIDELTGLYNRRGFLLLAREQLLLANRTERNLLVFYADLDGLKQINDRSGHIAGDQAIIKAAQALRETFRTSDIKARLGGDEFIVLAVEAEEHSVQTLLARLRERLAEKNQSMSVGVVICDARHETSIDEIIARADKAMYAEKRGKQSRRKM